MNTDLFRVVREVGTKYFLAQGKIQYQLHDVTGRYS